MKCAVFAVAVLFSFWCTVGAIDVISILEEVPVEDRKEFMQYYAQRGYDLITNGNGNGNSKSMPDEFAISVYQYIEAKNIVCFEDGTCLDIGDVGVHPKL